MSCEASQGSLRLSPRDEQWKGEWLLPALVREQILQSLAINSQRLETCSDVSVASIVSIISATEDEPQLLGKGSYCKVYCVKVIATHLAGEQVRCGTKISRNCLQ